MVRTPCCEKVGLKKGPWTIEEDQILINHIHNFGHANWRALPRQAGLLRCGKSCRLRWINYLRPDIKRGNFTREEEDTIINLHQMLGNRWSAIAAKLAGRTDNEIKNVWHTHLKKRLKQNNKETKASADQSSNEFSSELPELQPSNSSEFSSANKNNNNDNNDNNDDESSVFSKEANTNIDFSQTFPEIDESFWSSQESLFSKQEKEALLAESSSNPFEVSEVLSESNLLSPFNSMNSTEQLSRYDYSSSNIIDDVDFWYDIFIRSGGTTELSEF